ncbi:conserved hypothetical protein [Methylocella silvestris BL2]|uniref:Uncharacterized protein n=1 Tax=Methylocella silvestris (strain DSM 15510 / CIP 108128 / LMG 27833 / NCIMB 13906 / BL2) TaxID=395965 RepID=B8ESL9_METSB|nr:hypothetical protein [Methylocella silvestris]ACK50354.1 conserved hypothetical protein [Methylocella silvestris BL2]
MAGKADFTADEWSKILTAPVLAGMAVTLAEPSGLFGMIKEGFASGHALLEARNDPGAAALAKAVVADIETSEGRTASRQALEAEFTGADPGALKARALSTLAEVGALVDAKAPQDAPGFKDWLKHIAEKTAEASSEGGFLGFGGVRVTEAEKATVSEIASALKLPA